jgi:hypothetical protein
MDIDETWSPRIQVREEIVEFEKVDRVYGNNFPGYAHIKNK